MYTLMFPFRLQAGQKLGGNATLQILDKLFLTLSEGDPYNILTVRGFESEIDAKDDINRVWAGLMWVLLNLGLSFRAKLDAQEVEYVTDPENASENLSKSFGLSIDAPVDCIIDGSYPAVYPTEKRVRTVTFGDVTLNATTPSSTVLSGLAEGFAFPRSQRLIEDEKLRFALELYAAYFTEISNNAKFLNLIMALEALKTGSFRPQRALDLVGKWEDDVEQLLSDEDEPVSPEEAKSLESLKGDLKHRREISIGDQIYNLVFSTLKQDNDVEAEQQARKAKKLYNLRGKLVHKGKLPDDKLLIALSEAEPLVKRILRIKYLTDAK